MNNWTDHGTTENSGTIALTGGQKYAITMEFYEDDRQRHGAPVVEQCVHAQSKGAERTSFPAGADEHPRQLPDGVFTSPAGYVKDGGLAYGDRDDGQTYGWNIDNTAQMRDRNSAGSPDQRYDSLAYMQRPANPDAVWERAVPNGTYLVRAMAGDPTYFNITYRLGVEGVLTVEGTSSSASRWVEGTSTVTVSDGRLTIRSASGATANKICFVEITPQ